MKSAVYSYRRIVRPTVPRRARHAHPGIKSPPGLGVLHAPDEACYSVGTDSSDGLCSRPRLPSFLVLVGTCVSERRGRGGRADDARGRRTRAGLDMRVLAITLATISHHGYNVLDGALALRQRAMIAMGNHWAALDTPALIS